MRQSIISRGWTAAALAGLALAGCAHPSEEAASALCTNDTGTHEGFFYTFWHDTGDACMTLDEEGRYGTRWNLSGGGNVVAGKGWRTGTPDRVVSYRAETFVPGTNGYLTLYGWSRGPLVEYYVVDNWGEFKPPGRGAEVLGTVQSDGGTYEIYRTMRVEKPSIEGTQTFPQFWSVRTERRPLGADHRITFANHVRAWRAAGLELGQMDYQVLATEGFSSDGHSDVTVREE